MGAYSWQRDRWEFELSREGESQRGEAVDEDLGSRTRSKRAARTRKKRRGRESKVRGEKQNKPSHRWAEEGNWVCLAKLGWQLGETHLYLLNKNICTNMRT